MHLVMMLSQLFHVIAATSTALLRHGSWWRDVADWFRLVTSIQQCFLENSLKARRALGCIVSSKNMSKIRKKMALYISFKSFKVLYDITHTRDNARDIPNSL
jgi:hypothetical protein